MEALLHPDNLIPSTPITASRNTFVTRNVSTQTSDDDAKTKEHAAIKIPAHIILNLSAAINDLYVHMEEFGTQHAGLEYTLDDLRSSLNTIRHINSYSPSFHQFPRFPVEIRLKIWKLAAHISQIIGLMGPKNPPMILMKRGDSAYERTQKDGLRLSGNAARCHLLITCKESRQEVLKYRKNYNAFDELAPKIYANTTKDILWLHGTREYHADRLLTALRKGSIGRLRSLAVGWEVWKRLDFRSGHWLYELGWGGPFDLDEIIFIVNSEAIAEDDVPLLIEPSKSHPAFWKLTEDLPNIIETWEEAGKQMTRLLHYLLSVFEKEYKRHNCIRPQVVKRPAELEHFDILELSKWTVPELKFRDIVGSKSIRNPGLGLRL